MRLVFCCCLNKSKEGLFSCVPASAYIKQTKAGSESCAEQILTLSCSYFLQYCYFFLKLHLAIIEMLVQKRIFVGTAKGMDSSSTDFDLYCSKFSLTSLDSLVLVSLISVWLKGCCDVSCNLMSYACSFCLMPGCGKCAMLGWKHNRKAHKVMRCKTFPWHRPNNDVNVCLL